jgi:5-formyltetrahydrofolate cyclo-ligase
LKDKQAFREHVWALLERAGASRFPGARGRIPNYLGAEAAARGLASTKQWGAAEVVKANPDAPQLPVRALALEEEKILYMAVPRLRQAKPFLLLDPRKLGHEPHKAASIRVASSVGQPVSISRMRPVDLVVCGSVAVNRKGARIGKGGGFSDLEFGLLTEAGLLSDATTVATTVHPLQIMEEDLPEAKHDFRVDLIVTPDEIIRPRRTRHPPGIVWSELDEAKIAEIPVLQRLAFSVPLGGRTRPSPPPERADPD